MARRSIGIVLMIVSLGCSDSHRDVPSPEPDAGQKGQSLRDGDDPPEGEPQKPLQPPPAGQLTGEAAAWAAASDFEIQLESTPCYGGCPAYKMVLFANGDLRFTGYQLTWKPGTYGLQRTAASAVKLYENLLRRGFLELRDSYAGPEECTQLWTDASTTIFTLRAGEREKRVKYYKGCEGELAALATMDAMEREIIEATELEPYLKGASNCFRSDSLDIEAFETDYVLRDADERAVGLLHFGPGATAFTRGWSVTTCDGRELARADRLLHWSCGWMMMPPDETALNWPGVDVMPAAVVLTRPKDGGELAVQLFTFDDELSQHVQQGDSCD